MLTIFFNISSEIKLGKTLEDLKDLYKGQLIYKSAKIIKGCLEAEISIVKAYIAIPAPIVNKNGINPLRIVLALTIKVVTVHHSIATPTMVK